MRVALVNPPAERGYIRSGRWTRKTRGDQQWYPIWLGYATALLEREGHECLLIDAPADNLTEDYTLTKLRKFRPKVCAVYFGYETAALDLMFADKVGTFCDKVILVGPWSYCLPEALRSTKNVQLMTYGEFEHTLLEIVESPFVYSNIKGTYWKDNLHGEITKNPPRKLVGQEELDRIPFVTTVYKKFLKIRNYRQTSLLYPFLDLLTSRSCPHRCTYCVWIRALQREEPNRYRVRSIRNVVDELWWIRNNLNVEQVFFQDDTLPNKRALEISQAILDEKLNICWGGYARAELPYETLQLMKESGCRTLHVGYEVPIQQYLDIIHKDITVEQMKEFAENIHKLGLWTSATFMIFPWETENEIKETVEWCKAIKPRRMNLIQAQPYPNTPYAETVKEFKERYHLMTYEEMEQWERYGFKKFYFSKRFLWETAKSPKQWRQVLGDAKGLLKFIRG